MKDEGLKWFILLYYNDAMTKSVLSNYSTTAILDIVLQDKEDVQ